MFKVREFFKSIYNELDDCEVSEVDNHYKTVLKDLLQVERINTYKI